MSRDDTALCPHCGEEISHEESAEGWPGEEDTLESLHAKLRRTRRKLRAYRRMVLRIVPRLNMVYRILEQTKLLLPQGGRG